MNTTETDIFKYLPWYSLSLEYYGSIKTRLNEGKEQLMWSVNELSANLADGVTAESKRRLGQDSLAIRRPAEPRTEREQLKATPVFQAIGGVAVKQNTEGMKYFKNIRSCGAVQSTIWDAVKRTTMGDCNRPIGTFDRKWKECNESAVTWLR